MQQTYFIEKCIQNDTNIKTDEHNLLIKNILPLKMSRLNMNPFYIKHNVKKCMFM